MVAWLAIARVPTPGRQPEKTSGIPAAAKSVRIVQGQNVGHAISVPTPFTCLSREQLRDTRLGDLLDSPIVFRDALVQRFISLTAGQNIPQLWAQSFRDLPIHLPCAALLSRSPYDFVKPRVQHSLARACADRCCRARITVRWICALHCDGAPAPQFRIDSVAVPGVRASIDHLFG